MSFWLASATALWLGVLTSISPCPLASNIAAISFVGRRVGQPRYVLLAGVLYTLGRTIAYVGLAAVILLGTMGSGEVSRFLQRYMNQMLGPVLILVGMLLLGLMGQTLSLNLAGERVQAKASSGGIGWALILGALFALSFCPVSAGLYFGSLLPLAGASEARWLTLSLFGVGTALPVIVFAFLIAFASQQVGKAFDRLTQVEWWVRHVTGVVFILAGIYYCVSYIYGISLFA